MLKTVMALALASVLATVAPALAEPPPVEDYGKLPGVQQLVLSPSGERFALVATVGEKRRLIVATTANKPLEADDLGVVKVKSLAWAGEDHLLVFTSTTVDLGLGFAVSKNELGSVFVIDLKHNKTFAVFSGQYGQRVATTVVGFHGTSQVAGHWYGYFGGYTYDRDADGGGRVKQDSKGRLYPDLYKVDLDTGEFHVAGQGQDGIRSWLVGPSGDIAARLVYEQKSGAWRLQASNWAGVTLATGSAPTGKVGILGYGRTPQTALIYVGGGDHDVVQELPIAGGVAVATYNADEIGVPLFDPVTHLWIGSAAHGGDESSLFSPAQQAKLRGALRAFPGYQAHLTSYSADFSRMIVFTEGGDDSGTYWAVDISKHSAEPIGSPYPTVRPGQVGAVSWVNYKAADGLAMRGVLTLPPGRPAKALPLVVMPHGGPEAHDSLRFDFWAQAFAARGYAVFQPNFRGSNGSGNKFRDAGFGQWGRKMQTDISDGVAELARRGIVDPKRACIVGASYGGYAALAGVTVQHGLYRCAVSYGGVANPGGMLTYESERTGGFGSATRYWREFMGVTSVWQTELNDISPIRLADHADAPILLIHGKDDTVVPIDQSQSMEQALRHAGKPVELIALPGADHWLLQEDARVAMLKASVAFVMKNNPPDVSLADAK
jgi:dipeptidyl aminopeptidase/acylaminoacyl peptidase